MGSFVINKDKFLLNNSDFKLISGAMHYFRIPREYWRDRLEKLKMMGCNTVETYIPWILHEPEKGVFDFSDNLDIVSFVKEAEELSLSVILRPGPYICGEFEFGGLPWWLLKSRTIKLRSKQNEFIQAVDHYFDRLICELTDLQIHKNGSVIAFQVENEYGYYGMDSQYLNHLKEGLEERGIEVPLFTSDGPWGDHLEYGRLPGILQTANFGSGASGHFQKLKKIQPDKPLVCMEFWMGWFDAWGDKHNTRDVEDAAQALDEILSEGHVNLYMFHGGTNLGFTSGANFYDEYKPDVTSYDYDSPLSESGEITEKFLAFKRIISKYVDIPKLELSTTIKLLEPQILHVKSRFSLYQNIDELSTIFKSDSAVLMEDLDQGFGYINYRLNLKGGDKELLLSLSNCSDRALVYIDNQLIKTVDYINKKEDILLEIDDNYHLLDILVENQGRVNFGHKMNQQRKGIDGGILINGCEMGPVSHYQLPLTSPPERNHNNIDLGSEAGFHFFEMNVELADSVYCDSFIDMRSWGKGVVFVNGRNLGRFWNKGPQCTLYLPGPFLKNGLNSIVVFETEGLFCENLPIIDKAILCL